MNDGVGRRRKRHGRGNDFVARPDPRARRATDAAPQCTNAWPRRSRRPCRPASEGFEPRHPRASTNPAAAQRRCHFCYFFFADQRTPKDQEGVAIRLRAGFIATRCAEVFRFPPPIESRRSPGSSASQARQERPTPVCIVLHSPGGRIHGKHVRTVRKSKLYP